MVIEILIIVVLMMFAKIELILIVVIKLNMNNNGNTTNFQRKYVKLLHSHLTPPLGLRNENLGSQVPASTWTKEEQNASNESSSLNPKP